MRILHVGIGNLGGGGVATYVRSVVNGLRERGHEIRLFELWPGRESLPEVQERVHDIASLVDRKNAFGPDVVHLHSQLPDYGGFGRSTVLTAHDHSSHCPSGGRYLEARGRACARRFGLVNCLWGHYVDRCGSRNPSNLLTRLRITATAPSFPGTWIAPSRYSREMLVERGMDPSRIELLPNPVSGLPTNASELSSPGDFVLFLGRLVPNKGCDILIRSMVSIPSARLEIVGDGPERERLEKIAAALGVGDRVAFLGWRSPGEVRERLSEARVLAVPALWPEPFGLVALEAYAAGRPVVASSIGGLLDTVLDGKTGLLVPPGEPGRLSVALQRLLADRNLAERMGRAGLDRVRNRYGMEAHIESLERIYEQTTSVDSAG